MTVDAELLEAARQAVSEGRAANLSAWVSQALRRQIEHDERMRAGDAFFAAYEAEHGEITDDEMEAAHREIMARAIQSEPGREPVDPERGRAA